MTHAFPTRRASELARLALQGTRYENLIGRFTGPTSVTTSTDPVSAAKAIVEFANSNDKLSIVGGGLGERALSPDEVKELGRAHVCTPGTNSQLVCRPLLDKKKQHDNNISRR